MATKQKPTLQVSEDSPTISNSSLCSPSTPVSSTPFLSLPDNNSSRKLKDGTTGSTSGLERIVSGSPYTPTQEQNHTSSAPSSDCSLARRDSPYPSEIKQLIEDSI